MYDGNIKTRVNLVNTTIHNLGVDEAQAGRVGYIGSFPSTDNGVYEFTSLKDLRKYYNITPKTYLEREFEGGRDSKRLFMEGIPECRGVTSLTCVNLCDNTLDLNALKTSLSVTTNSTSSTEAYNIESDRKVQDAMKMTYKSLEVSLNKLSDDDIDMLYIGNDLYEAVGTPIAEYTVTGDNGKVVLSSNNTKVTINGTVYDIDGTHIVLSNSNTKITINATLDDVFTLILDFLNSGFSTKRPTYWVARVRTTGVGNQPTGIPSTKIDVLGAETEVNGKVESIQTYGAKQITRLLTSEANEVDVAALFYQGGSINGEPVGAAEMTAHMAGWIASLPVSQDLTYLTIPGVDGIDEEAYFGEEDAGYYLNKFGINVIKPKGGRKNKQFCVNNSVTPNGWHMNQVRALAYLLKKLTFEAGLGINNLTTQLETFKANLNTIARDVLKEVEIITEITFDDKIIVHSHDHIELSLNVEVGGVVTRIDIGVNMTLQNPTNVVTSAEE